MIRALMKYGPLVSGINYKILNEGNDWMQVSSGGVSIYAPRWVFGLKDKNLT